jgi:glycosyltransferase involved in cell wall biosynthesis
VEGFICPVRDVGALAAALEALAGDRRLWERMRAASLARVDQLGGWRQYGDRWEHLLETLTSATAVLSDVGL